jgi:hypothetical protein
MIKTKSIVIVLAMMMVFGVVFAFAQESNTSKATMGEFTTDVDNFLSSTRWKNMEMENFFAFSRFGANIADAKLDLGTAFKIGGLYLGMYFDGSVYGTSIGTSYTGERFVFQQTQPATPANTKGETFKVSERTINASNNNYGLLVGVGGLGIKATFFDGASISSSSTGTAATGTFSETFSGNSDVYVEAGLGLGPFSRVGLGFDIVSGHTKSITIDDPGSVEYLTTFTGVTTQGQLMDTAGTYVEPRLFLAFDFDNGLSIWNDLSFRIFYTPDVQFGGKSGSLSGVGYSNTVYDFYAPTVAANANTRTSVWDKRGYFSNTLTPMYNFGGSALGTGTEEEEGFDRLSYSITAALPITLTFINHALNAKWEQGSNATGPVGADWEVNDFYKRSFFGFQLAPEITAGLKFQLARMFSIQGGLKAELFDWRIIHRSETEVKPSDDDTLRLTTYSLVPSEDSSHTWTSFNLPKLSFSAGFSMNFRDTALVDLVLIKVAHPTAAGSIYKAVGDGLGSGDTSIVLSIKF